jgi:hypothetical protein
MTKAYNDTLTYRAGQGSKRPGIEIGTLQLLIVIGLLRLL